MKPRPAPEVPGSTDAERFSNALRIALSVSKEQLLREAKWKRAKKKRGKAPA